MVAINNEKVTSTTPAAATSMTAAPQTPRTNIMSPWDGTPTSDREQSTGTTRSYAVVTPDSEYLKQVDYDQVDFDTWMDYDHRFNEYKTANRAAAFYDTNGTLLTEHADQFERLYGATRRSLFNTYAYTPLAPHRGGMGRPPQDLVLDTSLRSHVYPRGHGVRFHCYRNRIGAASPCRSALQRREKRDGLKMERMEKERAQALEKKEAREEKSLRKQFLISYLGAEAFESEFSEDAFPETMDEEDSEDEEAVGFDGYEPSDDEVDWI